VVGARDLMIYHHDPRDSLDTLAKPAAIFRLGQRIR
jgi:hypothetical protein